MNQPPTNNPIVANVQNGIQNVQNGIQNGIQSVQKGVEPIVTAVQNNVSSATQAVQNNLKEFSSPQNIANASPSFLDSNGIIAKFVFLILVVIVFLLLMNLGIMMVGYYLQPPNNPYLIQGMIQGSQFVDISRDPKNPMSVTLKHSNNQKSGMEFSWSLWLNLQKNTNTKTDYSHIFSVGNNTFDPKTGLATVENGPGVYLSNLDSSGNQLETANLHVVMDCIPDGIIHNQSVNVTNLPYNKWFNVVLRMNNTLLDIYINGIITSRLNFTNVPKQNYGDVLVCANGGFIGALSNLRYYDYGMNVFEIGSVVFRGPTLTAAKINQNVNSTQNGYNYLSNKWYASKLN
jgi:hypothetical protein